MFPTEPWTDDDVADFFCNRFGDGRREWVKKGRWVLRDDGTYGPRAEWVRTWAACRRRATELLGRQAVDGVDYAIAEAVHCKSKREVVEKRAVTKAAPRTCADRYLRKVADLSPARVIVSFGGIADHEIRRVFALGSSRFENAEGRYFIFVDHPVGPGDKKKIADALTAEQIEAVRASINAGAAEMPQFVKFEN